MENEGPIPRVTLTIKVHGLCLPLAHIKVLTHVTVLLYLSNIKLQGLNPYSRIWSHLVLQIKVQ